MSDTKIFKTKILSRVYILLKCTMCVLGLSVLNMSVNAKKNNIHEYGRKNIYVYDDDGTSQMYVLRTILMLKEFAASDYSIRRIKASAVIRGDWMNDAAMLVIPGGADLPYAAKLNGKGNDNIKSFVKNGGSFFGVCAGAWYGTSAIAFDRGGPLEIVQDRELAFFPGSAEGPLEKYNYNDLSGIKPVKITYNSGNKSVTGMFHYHGGPIFKDAKKYKNVKVVGKFVDYDNQAAVVYMPYGKGRVVLSSMHFEYNSDVDDLGDKYVDDAREILAKYNKERYIIFRDMLRLLGLRVSKLGVSKTV